jgi:hypothetical protein
MCRSSRPPMPLLRSLRFSELRQFYKQDAPLEFQVFRGFHLFYGFSDVLRYYYVRFWRFWLLIDE